MITRLQGEAESHSYKDLQRTFAENEKWDMKGPDWTAFSTSLLPHVGQYLPQNVTDLPEYSEGFPFYMAMGFRCSALLDSKL